jgi:hypothetical protein
MTVGGRPPSEGGHKPIRMSLNAETLDCLKKLEERGEIRSKFVEQVLKAPCKELDDDPRPGCKDILDIKKVVDEKFASAVQDEN